MDCLFKHQIRFHKTWISRATYYAVAIIKPDRSIVYGTYVPPCRWRGPYFQPHKGQDCSPELTLAVTTYLQKVVHETDNSQQT